MLANVLYELKMKFTMPCYTSGDQSVCANEINDRLPKVLDFKLNKGSKFLCGDSVSWLDFVFLEFVFTMEWLVPTLCTDYSCLTAYKASMCALPGLKEYIEDPNCIEHKYTFNNKVAKLNNQD